AVDNGKTFIIIICKIKKSSFTHLYSQCLHNHYYNKIKDYSAFSTVVDSSAPE
ncbi:MAG: hypothetical protein AVDCRST_MAG96-2248, partial [uncultured Segetibacter sp.]